MRKVIVFVATRDADRVCDAIARTAGGKLGNYSESVSRALSQGFGTLQALDEKRIEFACDDDTYTAVVEAIYDTVPRYATTVDSWALETLETVVLYR